jgi:hypothetical protein
MAWSVIRGLCLCGMRFERETKLHAIDTGDAVMNIEQPICLEFIPRSSARLYVGLTRVFRCSDPLYLPDRRPFRTARGSTMHLLSLCLTKALHEA